MRILISLAVLTVSVAAQAANPKDEAAIRKQVTALEAAWNARDLAAYTALFAPDADRISLAEPLQQGRDEIAANMKTFFGALAPSVKLATSVRSVRFLGDRVAIVETDNLVANSNPPKARATWTFERRNGEWLVAASRSYEAQSATPPGENYKLPTFTLDQRWDRMEFLGKNFLVAGGVYAKSKGESVDAYGRHLGKLMSPNWSANLTPMALARGYYVNASSWKDFDGEIVSADDNAVVLRANRPWVADFGASGKTFGMTADDFDAILHGAFEEIGHARGLSFEQRRDGDHLITIVRRK